MLQKTVKDTTILVVEDKLAMRTIVKTVLYQLGVRNILEAADGEEAMSLLLRLNKNENDVLDSQKSSSQAIDCLISDWNMPKMNGLQLLEKIRQDEALKHLPFMMLTSEAERGCIVKAIEIGVNNYIIKPFTSSLLKNKLLEMIQEVIS